jgi:acetyl-CoA synthetase
MMRDLSRLLRPRSIAVIGGGAWCAQVVKQSVLMGFSGDIQIVHPKGVVVEGIASVPAVEDLPHPPDAVFIGVNRHVAIDVVGQLARMGAGGAVCFASGFAEAAAEDVSGADLQAQLVAAAGDMPLLGPNCYGYINALDGALLWPDQHGCARVETGVAILTQSSNIAINLTMQLRGLPIAYTVACGNMAQTAQADIALGLLDDPRVTAIGLHIEGFGDTAAWHRLAMRAIERGVPLVALKVGASEQAQRATVSHTASLAGGDAGAQALLARLGIGRVRDLPTFVETLKLLHVAGPLDAPTLSSISCSGGEASLAADTAHGRAVSFPALTRGQRQALGAALGPMVALSNPLDYNTYIWRDAQAMTQAWAPMAADHIGLTLLIVDYPHTDATDWECATLAALRVRAQTGRPVAMVATLPELMPLSVAQRLMAGGVVPMNGLTEAIAAAEIAAHLGHVAATAPLPAGAERSGAILSEADAKRVIAQYGVPVPKSVSDVQKSGFGLSGLTPPFAVKGLGLAHKTEAGAVRLNVGMDEVNAVLAELPGTGAIVEEMVTDGVVELLVGVTRDPAHGFVLTLGAGGVLTELLADTVSMLLPVDEVAVKQALTKLKCAPLLTGYRGKPAADLDSIAGAIMAVQSYVIAQADVISEVEINPLICTPTRAVAADALIRIAKD